MASDSSHANVKDVVVKDDGAVQAEPFRSQKGLVCGLSSPQVAGESAVQVYVLEWKSQLERRVCRSTLAAETYALATGAEHADWLKALLCESRSAEFCVGDWEALTSRVRSRWLVDAKSVSDHLSKDVGVPTDKRLAIEMMALKQLLRRGGEKFGDQLEWIDTTVQPADVLTKSMDFDLLKRIMEENRYESVATVQAQAGKKRKAELRQARRHGEKAGPFADIEVEKGDLAGTLVDQEAADEHQALLAGESEAEPEDEREWDIGS